MNTRIYWDFTGHADEKHLRHDRIKLIEGLRDNKIKLSREQKNRLPNGITRDMGWAYDFRSVLTKFVVKTEHYMEEVYAYDKTAARERFKGLGRVIYIVEVPK